MTIQKIRVSPSGPFVLNAAGDPLGFGPGAQLRLTEGGSTIGGTLVIPTVPVELGTTLGGTDQRMSLSLPKTGLSYRAEVSLDILNPTTNVSGEVQLYLDTSVDGGVSWDEQASGTYLCNPSGNVAASSQDTARPVRLNLILTSGAVLGVTSSPASPSLLLRARVGATSGGGTVRVQSPITPGGDTHSVGTFHVELSEHF